MSTERDDAYLERAKAKLSQGFQGEEDVDAAATPQKDLVSACVIAAMCIGAMVLAWQMPDPGRTIYTHPGLMPMVVGASLLAMVIGLAVRAVREGGARNLESLFARPGEGEAEESGRAWILIALVIVFVAALDWVTFRLRIPVGSIELKLSSFECVAIPMITLILKIFWKQSVLRCLLTAAVAVLLLTAAFRYGFKIPMPGAD